MREQTQSPYRRTANFEVSLKESRAKSYMLVGIQGRHGYPRLCEGILEVSEAFISRLPDTVLFLKVFTSVKAD